MNKITEVEMSPSSIDQELKVVGTQMLQVQFEDRTEGIDVFFNLSRQEARNLAETLIEHCDLGDKELEDSKKNKPSSTDEKNK